MNELDSDEIKPSQNNLLNHNIKLLSKSWKKKSLYPNY